MASGKKLIDIASLSSYGSSSTANLIDFVVVVIKPPSYYSIL